MMNATRKDVDSISTLAIGGTLDALTAVELRKYLESLLADSRFLVVVDLTKLELIDSSGVAAIVSLFKRTRSHGGDVKIGGLQGQPAEIFRLLRLERAFDTFATVDEAIAAFPAS